MIQNILFTAFFAFVGWLFWNWVEFNLTKNKAKNNNEPFSIKAYKDDKWEEWIGSFILAIILILVGHAGIGFELVEVINKAGNLDLKWSDLWYAASGPLYELILFLAVKVWKK